MKNNAPAFVSAGLSIALVLLCACSSELATNRASESRFAEAPQSRPGLGTKWAETRESRISLTGFQRADPPHPITFGAIYYNDEAGIRATAAGLRSQRSWSPLAGPADSLVAVGLKDPIGFFYPSVMIGDRWFVIGQTGRRYTIAVRNKTEYRLEVVLSVDGLDVIDGRKASLRKRGYVIEPYGRLTVDGFRQSTQTVAAFRFGAVQESYAQQKYGETRDVGVIGFAVFNERGTNLPTGREVRKRLLANPFPGTFATPP